MNSKQYKNLMLNEEKLHKVKIKQIMDSTPIEVICKSNMEILKELGDLINKVKNNGTN